MKYRKKPVEIEAIQLNWKNWNDVCDFLGDIISEENPARNATGYSDTCGEPGPEYIELTIPTLEGDHIARHGDYIIKGIKGEFYLCKPDVFKKSYDISMTCEEEGIALHEDLKSISLRIKAYRERFLKEVPPEGVNADAFISCLDTAHARLEDARFRVISALDVYRGEKLPEDAGLGKEIEDPAE
jgi:hypothetical protein